MASHGRGTDFSIQDHYGNYRVSRVNLRLYLVFPISPLPLIGFWRPAVTSELGLESSDLGCQLGNVFLSGHGEVIALRVLRLKLSSSVRACLRLGMCYVLVLMELQCICGMGTQGDKSLLDAWAEMR